MVPVLTVDQRETVMSKHAVQRVCERVGTHVKIGQVRAPVVMQSGRH